MGPLFIAISLPQEIKSQLQRLCFGLPSVNWTEVENLHLTLFYIGIVEGNSFLDIEEKLKELTFPSFSLTIKGIGCLHKKNQGEVRADVYPTESLSQLYQMIKKVLNELHLERSIRAFSPHITLGRYERLNENKLRDYLETNFSFNTKPFEVNEIILMSSETTKHHTFYVEHGRFFLKK